MNIFSLQLKKRHDERFLKAMWVIVPSSKSEHYREVKGEIFIWLQVTSNLQSY